MKCNILTLHEQIINKQKTIPALIDECIQVENKVSITNSVINNNHEHAEREAQELQNKLDQHQTDLLYGIPYAMKDNVSVINTITTGGSKFLENYVAPYSATIYDHLRNSNAIMLSKSSLDEFGMGGSGIYCYKGVTKNFHDDQRITGGSSSGSVNLVAAGVVPFAIATDTGDSARRPASFTGVAGFKPTYGLISRFGVLPYSPSLDTVGIVSQTVSDLAIVCDSLIKYDARDCSSQATKEHYFYRSLKPISKLNVGVVKGIEKHLSADVLPAYLKSIEIIKSAGHNVILVDYNDELLSAVHTIYYVISYGEACSCWSNLTGIQFGLNLGGKDYEDIILHARTSGLGEQVKRRFTIGAYVTESQNFEKMFLRSQRIRRYLVNK
jgi:aspartyl-tRNA(Asn)/glutamyl-tRNA(Gln) amidotransferase subunit A